jgi:hypothetical protein
MPRYKNRPENVPSDAPLRRHLSLRALLAMAKTRELRLTRIDTYPDPFEGTTPKKQSDNFSLLLMRSNTHVRRLQTSLSDADVAKLVPEDSFTRHERLRRLQIASAHACCWSCGEESEALWRLYGTEDGAPQGLGIALKTTLARLESSLQPYDEELYVSPIRYRHYHLDEQFDDPIDWYMTKRKGFEYEQEVRVLCVDKAHYDKYSNSTAPSELPEHKFYPWPILDHVEEITISPYADVVYEDIVEHLLGKIDPKLVPLLKPSILSARHYAVRY